MLCSLVILPTVDIDGNSWLQILTRQELKLANSNIIEQVAPFNSTTICQTLSLPSLDVFSWEFICIYHSISTSF